MEQVAEIIGVIGVLLVVSAYFLISSGRLEAYTVRYHSLNLVGSLGILFSVFYYWNLSTLLIQCIWIAISLYGLWRALRVKN